MIDFAFLIIIIVEFIGRISTIPQKCIYFFDKVFEICRSFIRQMFDEIKRTGEFTVTFKINRSVLEDRLSEGAALRLASGQREDKSAI